MSDVVIAVVGLGYWGPNLLRNAWELEHVRVKSICDLDSRALERQLRRYPDVEAVESVDSVLGDPEVDAVLLSTPIATHFELGRRCLLAGKHVFIEKPMAE